MKAIVWSAVLSACVSLAITLTMNVPMVYQQWKSNQELERRYEEQHRHSQRQEAFLLGKLCRDIEKMMDASTLRFCQPEYY